MIENKISDVRILIVDDNEDFLNLLTFLIKELGVKHLEKARSSEEGLTHFQKKEFDIYILDIDLGNSANNGIHLAEKIREKDADAAIIFITSNYTEHYYEASRHVRPSSFMNKELSRLKITQAIDLAMLNLAYQGSVYVKEEDSTRPPAPPTSLAPPFITQKKVFFKIGDTYKAIALEDIAFFFSKDKLTYAKIGKRNYPTNVKLKVLETELSPTFLRIHKTYIVNRNHIEAINPKENTVSIADEELPIGYAYRKPFMEQLNLLK